MCYIIASSNGTKTCPFISSTDDIVNLKQDVIENGCHDFLKGNIIRIYNI